VGKHLQAVLYVLGTGLFAGAFVTGALRAVADGALPGYRAHDPLRVARARMAAGDVSGAAREYRAAARVDPSNILTLDEYAAAMGRGKDVAAELDALFVARAMRPLDPRAHAALGAAFVRLGRYAEALASFALAEKLGGPAVPTLAGRGDAARGLGRFEEAAEAYARALEMEPGSAVLHNKLGVVRALEGRRDDALEQWRLAVRLDPGQREAAGNIARLLGQTAGSEPGAR
jgi:tetratricopeptide (TPR) repeat protein